MVPYRTNGTGGMGIIHMRQPKVVGQTTTGKRRRPRILRHPFTTVVIIPLLCSCLPSVVPWTSLPSMSSSHVFPAHSAPMAVTSADVLEATLTLDKDKAVSATTSASEDQRPFASRARGPRPARRLNHAFKYLYRHDVPKNLTTNAMEYLKDSGGYSEQQIIAMNQTFPPLLTLSVNHQLHPKLRFLKETLGIPHPHLETNAIPAEYFGARLEKILAPRHAWLVHVNLTHGAALFRTRSSTSKKKNQSMWTDFVRAARKPKGMAAMCTQWAAQQEHSTRIAVTTPQQIEAFDVLFGRGLLAIARNELVQHNNTWPLEHFDVSYEDDDDDGHRISSPGDSRQKKPRLTAADLTHLLIRHGANPYALDHRGVSLLHWAAGAGNLPVLKVLVDATTVSSKLNTSWETWVTERDHATLLHWAAAGAQARAFGCGGHVHICEYLLSHWDSSPKHHNRHPTRMNTTRFDYVNAATLDGNSALHWAAWSGTLETVKLLVRHRANVHHVNRNGCTVAHWAASGGNLQVCQYLCNICGVDFRQPNHGGNTPLTHAVAFGRANIVEWLRNGVLTDDGMENDQAALGLAQDFVGWLPTDDRRRQVLQLFQDFLDYDQGGASEHSSDEGDTVGTDDEIILS